MPTYDYRCETNGRVVEVRHGMSERLTTWGQLCTQKGMELGDTPPEAPVERLITGGQFISSSSGMSDTAPACNTGACCAGGICGLD
jgi:hypothetical protein